MSLIQQYLSEQQRKEIGFYLENEARPLDRAFHDFRTGEGDVEDVLIHLREFQNTDGGFGHSLEPDSALESSSVLSTTVAFQYLLQLPVESSHPLIQRGVAYLVKEYDAERGLWPIVPEEINTVPRAPWWQVNEETKETGFEKTPGNPGAEILGIFQRYAQLVPPDLLEDVTERIVRRWDEMTEFDQHEVQSYVRLAETTPVESIRIAIYEKLKKEGTSIFATTSDEWAQYGFQPYSIIKSSDSPLFHPFQPLVEENARWLTGQLHEGGWEPVWQWGQYEEEWQRAKKDWKSYLTVTYLHSHRYPDYK